MFEISEFGELIVAVDWKAPTKRVEYTTDQGLSWQSCLFQNPESTVNHTVIGINKQLSQEKDAFWIFTTWIDSNGKKGQSLFYINHNVSTGLPTCTQDDYELFNPYASSGECILGKSTVFHRKKQSAQCIADPSYLSELNSTVCECTRSDYYCKYCFKEGVNRTCVRDPNPVCLNEGVNCSSGAQTYTAPPPYRKVFGSKCIGDIKEYTTPSLANCSQSVTPPPPLPISPPSSSSSSWSDQTDEPVPVGWIVFGVVLGLLVVAGLVFLGLRVLKPDSKLFKFGELEEEEKASQPAQVDENKE